VAELTRAEKADARNLFEAKAGCEHCGGLHHRACPRVKRIERHPNGNVTAVEYFERYDPTGIIWPEDAFDPDDTEGASDQ
jgi:hypothetical protein